MFHEQSLGVCERERERLPLKHYTTTEERYMHMDLIDAYLTACARGLMKEQMIIPSNARNHILFRLIYATGYLKL